MKPWKEISRTLYRHSPHKEIVDVLFELPDGRQVSYALTHVGKVAVTLAFTADKKIVLARQFRPGPNRVMDELPGGRLDEGEDPETAVRRELQEETGYVAGRVISLGIFNEGAYSTIERHGFLALDCDRTKEQKLDQNEFIEVILKDVPEFLSQIRAADCTDVDVGWAGLMEAGFLKLEPAP